MTKFAKFTVADAKRIAAATAYIENSGIQPDKRAKRIRRKPKTGSGGHILFTLSEALTSSMDSAQATVNADSPNGIVGSTITINNPQSAVGDGGYRFFGAVGIKGQAVPTVNANTIVQMDCDPANKLTPTSDPTEFTNTDNAWYISQ